MRAIVLFLLLLPCLAQGAVQCPIRCEDGAHDSRTGEVGWSATLGHRTYPDGTPCPDLPVGYCDACARAHVEMVNADIAARGIVVLDRQPELPMPRALVWWLSGLTALGLLLLVLLLRPRFSRALCVAGLGLLPGVGADCERSADCPGDELCVEGKCAKSEVKVPKRGGLI